MPRRCPKYPRPYNRASIRVFVDDTYTLIRLSDTDEPSEGLSDTWYGLVLPARRHAGLEEAESRGGVFPNRSRDTRDDVGFNKATQFSGLDDYPRR